MPIPASVTFNIPDMTCNACVRAITQAVHRLDSVAEVSADLAAKHVTVRSANPMDFARAIEDAGFSPVAAD
ncbi:heavy-metal-associated domain-containing protein [Acidocella sp.]|nr:heavy-metal-associated domain-containing protein [Acidocella sp.]